MNKEEFLAEIKAGELPTKIEMPSEVEISKDGQNIMRPDIMQFLMTASIAAQAVKVRKYFDDRESVGWTQNFIIPVVPVVPAPALELRPTTPGQTMYAINDGPGVIFVEINKRFSSPTQLLFVPQEDMFIDFETHKIKVIFIWAAAAAAARVMVTG